MISQARFETSQFPGQDVIFWINKWKATSALERTLCQQSGLARGASTSLEDGAKGTVLADYLHIVTQYNAVSQRAVYEAGIYKVHLESGPVCPM